MTVSVSEVQKNSANLRSSVSRWLDEVCPDCKVKCERNCAKKRKICADCSWRLGIVLGHEGLSEKICVSCGFAVAIEQVSLSSDDKFGRGPQNFAVFRGGLGSTSKGNRKGGPEGSHLEALTRGVYGKRDGSILPSEIVVRTCPSCKKQMPVPIFGGVIFCENKDCGIELGHFLLRWQPIVPYRETCATCGKMIYEARDFKFQHFVDAKKKHIRESPECEPNGTVAAQPNKALWSWADLRVLQGWDGVEDDPSIKRAREIFSRRFNGKLEDGDASSLAAVYMKSVRQLLRDQRHSLNGMLESLLDSIVTIERGKS